MLNMSFLFLLPAKFLLRNPLMFLWGVFTCDKSLFCCYFKNSLYLTLTIYFKVCLGSPFQFLPNGSIGLHGSENPFCSMHSKFSTIIVLNRLSISFTLLLLGFP